MARRFLRMFAASEQQQQEQQKQQQNQQESPKQLSKKQMKQEQQKVRDAQQSSPPSSPTKQTPSRRGVQWFSNVTTTEGLTSSEELSRLLQDLPDDRLQWEAALKAAFSLLEKYGVAKQVQQEGQTPSKKANNNINGNNNNNTSTSSSLRNLFGSPKAQQRQSSKNDIHDSGDDNSSTDDSLSSQSNDGINARYQPTKATTSSSSQAKASSSLNEHPDVVAALWTTTLILIKGNYYLQESYPLDRLRSEQPRQYSLHAAIGLGRDERYNSISCPIFVIQRLLQENSKLSLTSDTNTSGDMNLTQQPEPLTGRLPLHIVASKSCTNIRISILELLVAHDPAAAYTKDASGKCPIHLAEKARYTWNRGLETLYQAAPHVVDWTNDNEFGVTCQRAFRNNRKSMSSLDTVKDLLELHPTLLA